MSKLTELNQELHALREKQHANIQEMKDAFEGGQEISVEKKQAIEDVNVELETLNAKVNELNALEVQEARLEDVNLWNLMLTKVLWKMDKRTLTPNLSGIHK